MGVVISKTGPVLEKLRARGSGACFVSNNFLPQGGAGFVGCGPIKLGRRSLRFELPTAPNLFVGQECPTHTSIAQGTQFVCRTGMSDRHEHCSPAPTWLPQRSNSVS